MKALIRAALAGERRALARLLTMVENDEAASREIVREVYPLTGGAHLVGITGAPGSGKSTLVARLARHYRTRGLTVAVVAVDPSSPFSGGAILGDRIRMQGLSGDPGVFVRSMASRGQVGGLARGTRQVARVLDACGYARILIETVGAGQNDIDVVRTAHTTLVLQTPGMGDEIQAMKAGILEIADILVVNKADLDGAARTVALLEGMLALDARQSDSAAWVPPIVKTVAPSDQGTVELVDSIERHVTYLHHSGAMAGLERARVREELQNILREGLLARSLAALGQARVNEAVSRVTARETDPYTLVSTWFEDWLEDGALRNRA